MLMSSGMQATCWTQITGLDIHGCKKLISNKETKEDIDLNVFSKFTDKYDKAAFAEKSIFIEMFSLLF